MGTKNYRLMLEAVPLDAKRSFVHMSYAYGYGFAARMAMEGYLATLGRNKVGFTITGQGNDGKPVYMGNVRGVVERNTMRYYLAIEAYLGALALPPAEQVRTPHERLVRQHRTLPAPVARDRASAVPRHEAPGSAAPAGGRQALRLGRPAGSVDQCSGTPVLACSSSQRHAVGQFDQLQALRRHVDHGQVGDDAVDHAHAGQRQRAVRAGSSGRSCRPSSSPRVPSARSRAPRRPPGPSRRPCP